MKRFTKMLALGMAAALTFGMTVGAVENPSITADKVGTSEGVEVKVVNDAEVTEALEATTEAADEAIKASVATQIGPVPGYLVDIKSVALMQLFDIKGTKPGTVSVNYPNDTTESAAYFLLHFDGQAAVKEVIPMANNGTTLTASLESYSYYGLVKVTYALVAETIDPGTPAPDGWTDNTIYSDANKNAFSLMDQGIQFDALSANDPILEEVFGAVTLYGDHPQKGMYKSALNKEFNEVTSVEGYGYSKLLVKKTNDVYVTLQPREQGRTYNYDYGYALVLFTVDGNGHLVGTPSCIHKLDWVERDRYKTTLYGRCQDNDTYAVVVRWERDWHGVGVYNPAHTYSPQNSLSSWTANRLLDAVKSNGTVGVSDLYESEYFKLYKDVVTDRRGALAAGQALGGTWIIEKDADIYDALALDVKVTNGYVEFAGLEELAGDQRYIMVTYGKDQVRMNEDNWYGLYLTGSYANCYEMKLVNGKHNVYGTNELQLKDAFAVVVKVKKTAGEAAPAGTITAPAGVQAAQPAATAGVAAGAAVSPKTGEVVSLAIILAAICLAGAAVCARKARCN